ncbi:MAG: sterol 3beta-glucosyltransferase [Clostridium sp.]|jgi:sterol 3beta-glucosyltransferase
MILLKYYLMAIDQPFWANRLHKMSYALEPLFEKSLTVNDLVQRFGKVENVKNINKAKEIKELIEQENGTENAINFIEKICESWINVRYKK